MKTIDTQLIAIGTRVYCCLYGGRKGTVYQIDGQQSPGTIRSFAGGAGVSGGNARMSVVFDNGSISKDLPEAIVRGIQWKIYDEVESAEQIAAHLAFAAAVAAQKLAEKEAAAARFAAEVESLKSAEDHAHLTQGDDLYSGKLAAVNIRKVLKVKWPKVKFSVRNRHYGSVDVSWTDGPTVAAVELEIKPFQGGKFDGMDDSRSFNKTPFIAVFGGCDYVHASRQQSAALIDMAIAAVFDLYPGNLAGVARPAAEEYQSGRLMNVSGYGLGRDLQDVVRQVLITLES